MEFQSYIGLGSNLNDPCRQVRAALECIDGLSGIRIVTHSSLYESPPMGPTGQADYINAVAEIKTRFSPLPLLGHLNALEEAFGRDRSVGHWGPRIIDLDILLFGGREISIRRLTVPHPGLAEREFVVFPLLEIAPDLVLPDGRALSDLAGKLDPKSLKKL